MFGKAMSIQGKAGFIQLRPFKAEEIACERVCTMFSDHEVTRYILMANSPTIKDEEEWYEKSRLDKSLYLWGIYLDDSPLIGITSLSITFPNYMGSTGFMLFDKSYWRKGIASTSHIARTGYAVNHLDLKTITSGVISPNTGSRKALESVGYFVTGVTLGERYRDGVYRNHINLQWIRPGYENTVLADEATPPELRKSALQASVIAAKALERAKVEVNF